MTTHTSQLVIKLTDQLSGPSKRAAAALKGINEASKSLDTAKARARDFTAAVERFGKSRAAFSEANKGFREAQARVKELAQQMKAAGEPSRKLVAEYKRAQTAVSAASRTFERQRDVFRQAKSAVEAFGSPLNRIASAERSMKAGIDASNRSLERQAHLLRQAHEAAARGRVRRETLGLIGGAAGVAAAYQGRRFATSAVRSAADFDIGVRRQRAYTGVSEAEQQQVLIPQAKRIGQETQFSNLDIVESQTAVMQRLPDNGLRAQVAFGITEEVRNYALALQAEMKTSAEAITAYLMSTGKDLSTQDKALKAARRTTNMLIRSAKLGGMNDEDLRALTRFGASSAHLAGFSDEAIGAFGIGMKRAGIDGDQAGTALRTISAKMVSPTQKGLAAMTAAGIDYNKYSKMPGGLSAGTFEAAFQQKFGKSLTGKQRESLSALLSDEDVVADRGRFTEEVGAIVSASFDRVRTGKNRGKLKATDQERIAKWVGGFHKMSAESVDAERLFEDILKADPSLGLLNAIFTDKHGGKVGALQGMLQNYLADKAELGTVPDDYGKKISDEIMGGLGGALERLKGSVENFVTSIGEANAKWLSYSFDRVGDAIDAISNMSEPARQAASVLGGIAALSAGGFGAYRIGRGLLGYGPAGALNGSALALNESAAALTAAAARLGAGGIATTVASATAGAAAGGAPAAAGALVGGSAAAALAGGAFVGLGLGTTYVLGKVLPASMQDPGSIGGSASEGNQRLEEYRQRLAEINKRLDDIYNKSKMPDVASMLADPLEKEKARVENAIADVEEAMKGIADIDLSGAGMQSMSTFGAGLRQEMGSIEAETDAFIGRLRAKLSFTATPTIRPQVNLQAGSMPTRHVGGKDGWMIDADN